MLATHGPCAPCSRVAAGGTHCLRAPVPRNEEIRNGKGVGARYRRRVECKAEGKKGGSSYFNFTGFPFPLGPFFDRKTIRKEVVKDTMWTFEQPQSLEFSTVSINTRMTVIKLKSGGLWVHAPIAPTEECLRLLKELGAPVEYIIFPTFAYEHKIFVGPFSRKFPKAKVYVAPRQWSWPISFPPQFFGIFPNGELKNMDENAPWSDEISQKLFTPPDVGIGPYVECVFFHKATKTLIVTDIVVYIPKTPLEIVPTSMVLDQARDDGLGATIAGNLTKEEIKAKVVPGPVEDTPGNRRKGWMRTVLLVLYFGPFNLLEPEASFTAIAGKWIVSPVVRILVYDRIPKSVTTWIDEVEEDWNFTSIIPCHFAGPTKAKPGDLSKAFAFSYNAADKIPKINKKSPANIFSFFSKPGKMVDTIPEEDLGTLNSLTQGLKGAGILNTYLE